MIRTARVLSCVVLGVSACAPLSDEVFTAPVLTSGLPLIVTEGAGVVELPLRLPQAPAERVVLAYRVVGLDAQQDCQTPDFEAADGRIEWPAGVTEASVRVWIGDDDLAERDERFEIVLESSDGLPIVPPSRVQVVIADDDRSALVDARELGVRPGVTDDQTFALQTALDEAASLGRAVVVMAPGDYEISSVRLTPGTTLSAHEVRFHRPADSAADLVSLRLEPQGLASSPPSLIEGLSIDGRREEQGAYQNNERQEAHLIQVQGDATEAARVRATLEDVRLFSGTGSGLLVGPNSDTTVCKLNASELQRDALTLNGGAASLRIRRLNATATAGTGLWFGAHTPGYQDSYRIDVEGEDVQIAAGDVEIEVSDGSRVDLRRLTMTDAPFRLDAPGGSVRIEDSVLVVGLASARHNHFAGVHDVQVTGSTIIATESDDQRPLSEEAREFSAISLISPARAAGPPSSGEARLGFENCRFELAPDVEANDVIYAIGNPDVDASVVVESSVLGRGFAGWFAPTCTGCTISP